jgi:hypothetical protein
MVIRSTKIKDRKVDCDLRYMLTNDKPAIEEVYGVKFVFAALRAAYAYARV